MPSFISSISFPILDPDLPHGKSETGMDFTDEKMDKCWNWVWGVWGGVVDLDT